MVTEEKYIVLYCNDKYILAEVGNKPFASLDAAKKRVDYFNENGFLQDAKYYKLEEV